MAHDAFVSHSSRDKPLADAVCAALEARGIRCWIAPRDVLPGEDWSGGIVRAIDASRVFVLVLSTEANRSRQVLREVSRAADRELPILPFRIQAVQPAEGLDYYIGTYHWLDALTPPMEQHLERLAERVSALLGTTDEGHAPERATARPEPTEGLAVPAAAALTNGWKRRLLGAAAALLLLGGVAAILARGGQPDGREIRPTPSVVGLVAEPGPATVVALAPTTVALTPPTSPPRSAATASLGASPHAGPGRILLQDTFDAPTPPSVTKSAERSGDLTMEYVAGELAFGILNPDLPHQPRAYINVPTRHTNTTIAVDARLLGELAHRFVAVSCRVRGPAEYWLSVRPDDGKFQFMLVKGPGADPYVSLLGDRVWEASPAIRRGHETNRLELSCIGPAMSATINGVPVHTTEDHTLSGGQLALSAGATLDANSTTVEARFDNLVVLER